MQISITFKNTEPSDDIKKYLHDKLKRFEKMIHHPEFVHVIFRVEKLKCHVDVNLVSKNFDIHATNEGSIFNEAIDLVLEKVRKQIIKTKEKIENHR